MYRLAMNTLLAARDAAASAAIPTTEAEIAATFADKQTFSLAAMYCQVPVDTYFAGILTMQVYSYFKYQKHDSWWIKGVVIATASINAGFTAYLWAFMNHLFVENFGLWSPFAETSWLAPGPFFDSLNSGIVQSFFAYRAYRLCGGLWIIPLVCGMLILTSIGATMSVWIIFSHFESLFQAGGVSVPELIWLSSIMSADIIITCSIIYGLLKSKTGWTHTDRIIVRLIRMTLESQMPPTIIAVTFMAEFVRTPSSLLGATMQGIQPKFYAVGLMYALNARVTFKQQWKGNDETKTNAFGMSNRPTQKTQLQVDVETETETYVATTTQPGFDRPGLNRGPYSHDDKKEDMDSIEQLPQTVRYNSSARLTDSNSQ